MEVGTGLKSPSPFLQLVDLHEIITTDVMIPIELLEALGFFEEVDRE